MARRWFQFHLATIIAVVIVASVLMGANFRAHPSPAMNGNSYGFPLPMYQNWKGFESEASPLSGVRVSRYFSIKLGGHEFQFNNVGWSYSLVAMNVCVWIVILGVTAFCVEKFMQSRRGDLHR